METEKRYIIGRVTDEHNEPILGVNILIKGTTKGTTTDVNGNYKINAPIGSQLVFSFIGRETKISPPIQKDTAAFNVVLKEIAEELDEVVVTPPKNNKIIKETPKKEEKENQENPIRRFYNPQTIVTKKKSYNDTLKTSKLLLVGGASLLFGLLLFPLDNSQYKKSVKKVAI
jgi:tonB-dependent outer membrane receptor|nr:MAG TPA: TonB-linked outer membrane protein, SusC/RagA family [Bacteriophage sp.]